MELDKRIKEGKRPLTCFDLKEASDFVNKTGYFANEFDYFSDLSKVVTDCCSEVYYGKLLGIKENKRCVFKYLSMDCSRESSYRFFIPEEWVKEPEKKFRAFTLAEWSYQHEIGEVIHFMNKDYKQEFNVMYTGYVIDNGEEDIQDNRTTGQIMLINMGYLLQELFERYEICINGEWLPFGVVEDD